MKHKKNEPALSPEQISVKNSILYELHEGRWYSDVVDRLDDIPQLTLDQDLRNAAYERVLGGWNFTEKGGSPEDFWFLELFGWSLDDPQLIDCIKGIVKKNAPQGVFYERQATFLEKILDGISSDSIESILFFLRSGLFRQAFIVAERNKKLLKILNSHNPDVLSAGKDGIAARLNVGYFNEARAALERLSVQKNDSAVLSAARSGAISWKDNGKKKRAQEISEYFNIKI